MLNSIKIAAIMDSKNGISQATRMHTARLTITNMVYAITDNTG